MTDAEMIPLFIVTSALAAAVFFAYIYFRAEGQCGNLLKENDHIYQELSDETRRRKALEVALMQAKGALANLRIEYRVLSATREKKS